MTAADPPVVIALDGSLHSAATLDWGMHEAELRDAPVVLAHVDDARVHAPTWDRRQWAPPPHVDAATYLEATREREAARRPGLELRTATVLPPVAEALVDAGRDAQLLVVGGGRDGAPHARGLAPVPARVAAAARCPVAVVLPSAPVCPTSPVVAGVDGTAADEPLVELAAAEAAARGAELVLVHAAPPRAAGGARAGGGVLLLTRRQRVGASTARLVAEQRRRRPGLPVTAELPEADPAAALVERSRQAALVVVGSRGLGRFGAAVLGSVAAEVLRRSATTVLVVHRPSRPAHRRR